MRQFSKYTGRVQQAFGLVMIVAALLIYTNYDKTLQLKILNAFPSYGHLFDRIENNDAVSRQLSALRGQSGQKRAAPQNASEPGEKLRDLGPDAEFQGISHWLNSGPLTMAQLRGKVALVDFWTYSCINCLRTLPNVTAWYNKYGPENFTVIGVHTPEFAFEKETANVKNAIAQFKIAYPVAQDNDFKTWNAFNNEYWPAEYLIDPRGRVRLAHFGEGHYDEMDAAIRQLLAEAGHPVAAASAITDMTPDYDTTPETYLGQSRMERFSSKEGVRGGEQTFTLPAKLPQNHFAYQGIWDVSDESGKSRKGSALVLHFNAEKVFLVIGPREKGDSVRLFLDGKPVTYAIAGPDVKDGRVELDVERLYRLIDLKGKVQSHLLKIEFENDGIAVYAFTFG